MTPERIQLRHTRGWRKPPGAIVVSRPSRWGNPFVINGVDVVIDVDTDQDWYVPDGNARRFAVQRFTERLHADGLRGRLPGDPRITLDDVRHNLAGHDLGCCCPLDQACHADILLEVANQ